MRSLKRTFASAGGPTWPISWSQTRMDHRPASHSMSASTWPDLPIGPALEFRQKKPVTFLSDLPKKVAGGKAALIDAGSNTVAESKSTVLINHHFSTHHFHALPRQTTR